MLPSTFPSKEDPVKIRLVQHSIGRFTLEDASGLCLGTVNRIRSRYHVVFRGVSNDYAHMRQLHTTFALLGHTLALEVRR